jgi:predicted ATPase
LYDVTLVPKSFTVLVGPNNAGKTNLADSLEFLGQIARNGLEVAVSREGGFENLAFRRARRTTKPVEFSVAGTVTGPELSRPFPVGPANARRRAWQDFSMVLEYAFALRASSESRDADFRVTSEDLVLRVYGPSAGATVRLTRREQVVEVDTSIHVQTSTEGALDEEGAKEELERMLDPFNVTSFNTYLEDSLEPTALVLNRLSFNVVMRDWLAELGRTRLFQLTPVECRRPGSATPNPELDRHGANLPAVVRYMQRNHRPAWTATLDAMRGVMPGLTAIETHFTTDRRLALLFHEKGARAWTSDEVSDGTIQSLALFTCLFDPRVPLALIEEPENSIHPWIVKMFVDACRIAEDKQVIVTTHSPALISYLRPSELDIVWRDGGGRTKVCSLEELDPQAASLWEAGELDLYELVDGGWIRQSVPPGLQ